MVNVRLKRALASLEEGLDFFEVDENDSIWSLDIFKECTDELLGVFGEINKILTHRIMMQYKYESDNLPHD